MNIETIVQMISQIGDEPQVIQSLRKLVVALAISGKIDVGESKKTAIGMRASLLQARATAVKYGKAPKQKGQGEITWDQLPDDFSDPSHFIPLGAIAAIEKGKTGIKQAVAGPYPLVVTAAERANCDHYDFDVAAAIIPLVSSTGHGNASINRLHYQEGRFALGTILAAVIPDDPTLFSARFLFEYLSAFKDDLLVSRMTGTANVTLSAAGISTVPIPLVSPSVQKVVNDIMVSCDKLEVARSSRQEMSTQLLDGLISEALAPKSTNFAEAAE